MVKMDVTTPKKLSEKRPYIIIAAFVVGMLLTPPDIFSQTLLAVPVWLLFELGLISCRFLKKKDDDLDEDEDQNQGQDQPSA